MTASDPARGERRRCLRSVGYYGNSQLLRPTVVLGAWTAAGATLILLGYLRQQRRLVQEAADQTMTEYAPGAPAEDPKPHSWRLDGLT